MSEKCCERDNNNDGNCDRHPTGTVQILNAEIDQLKADIKRAREALEIIARSAPCVDGHESFNSPGQPCDQRIASAALSAAPQEGTGDRP